MKNLLFVLLLFGSVLSFSQDSFYTRYRTTEEVVKFHAYGFLPYGSKVKIESVTLDLDSPKRRYEKNLCKNSTCYTAVISYSNGHEKIFTVKVDKKVIRQTNRRDYFGDPVADTCKVIKNITTYHSETYSGFYLDDSIHEKCN